MNDKTFVEREKRLSEYAGKDKVVLSTDFAEELRKTDDSVFTTKTGVPSLDRILDGVEAGELVIVTGPTGEGKTTLLMSITKNMATLADHSLWFTLEVTARQFMKKLDASGSVVPFYLPASGCDDVDEEYKKIWEKSHGRKMQMVDWIEDKIIETKAKYESEHKRVRAIFIDHIHMIFSLDSFNGKNASLVIGDMVAKIKQMAISHNVTIFLIAHSKDSDVNPNAEPRKEDVRDSGLITRFADTIIGVWRVNNNADDKTNRRPQTLAEDDNKTKVRVFKNRRTGKVGSFFMWHTNHYLTEDQFHGGTF